VDFTAAVSAAPSPACIIVWGIQMAATGTMAGITDAPAGDGVAMGWDGPTMRIPGHCRLELREDLLCRCRVAVQQVDRGHRQQFGRGQTAVLRFVDPPVGTVRLAFGGDHVRVDHRHHMREVAQIGRASAMSADVELAGPEQRSTGSRRSSRLARRLFGSYNPPRTAPDRDSGADMERCSRLNGAPREGTDNAG